MKKRGQLAVETLLIYGITLLIVMLAIGALIAFGVLDVGSLLPDKCTVRGSPLECSETLLSKSLGFGLAIDNNFGQTLGSLRLVRLDAADANEAGLVVCNLPPGGAFFTDSLGGQIATTCPDMNMDDCPTTARCYPRSLTNTPPLSNPDLYTDTIDAICNGNIAPLYDDYGFSGGGSCGNEILDGYSACSNNPVPCGRWYNNPPEPCCWSYPSSIIPADLEDSVCEQDTSTLFATPTALVAGERAQVRVVDCVPSSSLKAGRKVNLEFVLEYVPAGTAFEGPRTTTGTMTVSVVD